jgi:hypothetical protein
MARYRLLQDHYIGGGHLSAGTTVSTVDAGGVLPTDFVPTPAMDPLDMPAIRAFWNAGPRDPIWLYWNVNVVPPAKVRWVQVKSPRRGVRLYQLTGEGEELGPRQEG